MPHPAKPAAPSPGAGSALGAELLRFAPIYFFLSLISLRAKLAVTPAWTDGTLERNHELLLRFQYTNNEQSRILQFYVPELFRAVFGLSIGDAYLLQRWVFVCVALCLFHVYLRAWFARGTALGGAVLLAAVLPLTYMNDLQESAPLLMITFLLSLWAIRAGRIWAFAAVLLVGAMDNETSLVLPAALFFALLPPAPRLRGVFSAAWRTVAAAAPAFAYTVIIRYITRHQPHLGGAWHGPDNLRGIVEHLGLPVLSYYRARYLYFVFIFGALWVYAFLGWRDKPRFLRATLPLVPLFLLPHLITGIIREVRQMVPLGYVVIPAALWWLLPAAERGDKESGDGESGGKESGDGESGDKGS